MGWREWDARRTTRTRELDLGLVCEGVVARKWRLIGLPLAALVLIGAVRCLQPAGNGAPRGTNRDCCPRPGAAA
jgi:hypothetical protein